MKNTLLIIDDMPDNVTMLSDFLKIANFEVLVAYDGQDGIDTAEYAQPDVILLDVMMPEMDGFQVCQTLKSHDTTKDIPILFMTALGDTVSKVKSFELGAADYVTKPIQSEELLARVTAHLKLRKQQQQIQAQNDELQKRNQELDAFARTVAHDLKNPVGSILTLASLLAEECATAPRETLKKINIITLACQKTYNIINAILTLAGISRQAPIIIQPLKMSAIVQQVIKQRLSYQIKQSQAEIHLPEHWPMALGYGLWVEEIWVNYLSNGLKYGGQPPRLELGADFSPDHHTIRFWVRDNGQGLTPEQQARLFTPFTQVHQLPAEGYGLGLSIVQQIIEKLGGQAGVESTPGQGSVFYFTLPAVEQERN
jgi:signal transduction histidine kinase